MDFRVERFRSLYTAPEGKKPEDIIKLIQKREKEKKKC